LRLLAVTVEEGVMMCRIWSRFRLVAMAVPVTCAAVFCATGLAAQNTVAGRITFLEKPGEKTSDYANTIISLEPKAGTAAFAESRTNMAMNGRAFTPHVRVVTVGSTVDYPNQDPFSHNVFSNTPGAMFDLGAYDSGTRKSNQFRKAGAYPIYCNIHAKMAAYVVVVKTPWYAQAAADGRWRVANVPPGKYVLTAWHERAAPVVSEIDVPAAGLAMLETTLDARGYKEQPHKNKFGKDYANAGVVY
jgi:plastocyanin